MDDGKFLCLTEKYKSITIVVAQIGIFISVSLERLLNFYFKRFVNYTCLYILSILSIIDR